MSAALASSLAGVSLCLSSRRVESVYILCEGTAARSPSRAWRAFVYLCVLFVEVSELVCLGGWKTLYVDISALRGFM